MNRPRRTIATVHSAIRPKTEALQRPLPKLKLGRIAQYTVVLSLGIAFALPFFWTVSSSLKDYSELFVFPPLWLPAVPQWSNYIKVFEKAPFGRFILNTVELTLFSILGQVFSASLVGYGFARLRFRGSHFLFLLVLSTLILPAEVTLLPNFLLFRELEWLDTYLPLIVPGYLGGGAFFVFLFRQFFMTLPRDLDESAKIDGAGSFRIYRSIIIPLSIPVVATAVIFSFMSSWNDFMGPLMYLKSTEKFPLSLGLYYFSAVPETGGRPMEHILMAASVIMLLPCLVLFFSMQQYFVRGVVMSGIKG